MSRLVAVGRQPAVGRVLLGSAYLVTELSERITTELSEPLLTESLNRSAAVGRVSA